MSDLVGMDYAKDYSNFAAAIKGAGVGFVGRYYRWPASRWAPLTYTEAAALSDAGLFVVALWEWISNEISNFSYHDGFAQGSCAYRQAMTTHQPAGTPILTEMSSASASPSWVPILCGRAVSQQSRLPMVPIVTRF